MYKSPTRKEVKLKYLILKIADYTIENHATEDEIKFMSKFKNISISKWNEIQRIFKENMDKGRILGGINCQKNKKK